MSRTTTLSIAKAATLIADLTRTAYSAQRYRSWGAVATALLNAGYSKGQTVEIMESRLVRRAADASGEIYGRVPAKAVLEYLREFNITPQTVDGSWTRY